MTGWVGSGLQIQLGQWVGSVQVGALVGQVGSEIEAGGVGWVGLGQKSCRSGRIRKYGPMAQSGRSYKVVVVIVVVIVADLAVGPFFPIRPTHGTSDQTHTTSPNL